MSLFMCSCFINNTGVFFAAFLGPMLLLLSFNMIVFIVIIVVLVRHQLRRATEHNRKFGIRQLMINVTSIAFLFGLTWIFGALTVINAKKAFQIVFSLANSFQGFLIFIFFCVLNSEVRLALARKLHGKQSTLKTSTTGAQKRLDQYKYDPTGSVFVEDMPSLGSSAKLTRTISQYKHHMNEVVELKFDDDGTHAQFDASASSCTDQTDELAGIVHTSTRHIEEAVEIRLDGREKGGVDTSNDLWYSNKHVESEL